MKLHSFAFNYWHNMFLRFLDSSTLRSGMGLEAWEQFFSPFLRIDFTLYNPQELYHYIHFLGISWSDFNPQDLWLFLFITSYFNKKNCQERDSNPGPRDPRSDALPDELLMPWWKFKLFFENLYLTLNFWRIAGPLEPWKIRGAVFLSFLKSKTVHW